MPLFNGDIKSCNSKNEKMKRIRAGSDSYEQESFPENVYQLYLNKKKLSQKK